MFRLYCEDVTDEEGYIAVPSDAATGRMVIAYGMDPVAHAVAAAGLDGATVTRGVGYWKGIRERCTVIDLADASRTQAYTVARELRRLLRQDAVLIVELPGTVTVWDAARERAAFRLTP